MEIMEVNALLCDAKSINNFPISGWLRLKSFSQRVIDLATAHFDMHNLVWDAKQEIGKALGFPPNPKGPDGSVLVDKSIYALAVMIVDEIRDITKVFKESGSPLSGPLEDYKEVRRMQGVLSRQLKESREAHAVTMAELSRLQGNSDLTDSVEMSREIEQLKSLAISLGDRIHGQHEALAARAEKPNSDLLLN